VVAIPGIVRQRWARARPVAVVALLVVTIMQPILIAANTVAGDYNWSQGAVGWCLVPLLLAYPTRLGAGIVVGYWVAGAAVEVFCNPSMDTLINVGLGTASILTIQVFALVFNGLMRSAARDAQTEAEARRQLTARARLADALRLEYQRRYARLVANVVPLLTRFSEGILPDEEVRRQARAESRQLRALFDQAGSFDHPLMERMRRVVDAAEARGLEVAVDLVGELPHVGSAEIEQLAGTLGQIVNAEWDSARIVVSSIADHVSVSVVCRGGAAHVPDDITLDERIEMVTSDEDVWFVIGSAMPATSESLASA
jgi:hypothetical protein